MEENMTKGNHKKQKGATGDYIYIFETTLN